MCTSSPTFSCLCRFQLPLQLFRFLSVKGSVLKKLCREGGAVSCYGSPLATFQAPHPSSEDQERTLQKARGFVRRGFRTLSEKKNGGIGYRYRCYLFSFLNVKYIYYLFSFLNVKCFFLEREKEKKHAERKLSLLSKPPTILRPSVF